MAPRGPDGSGLWTDRDSGVCLGHRRLSIIDLSDAGAQPMHLEGPGLTVTFNGEIYNFRQLRAELEAKGRTFRSNSDTEILLHLYDEYGPEMCDRLRGMFAFALWDARRKGLLLARDHFGIKPLYYAQVDGRLVFASQVKALLASGIVPRDPDPAGHVAFHIWGNLQCPHTLYRSIRALPPGTTLWADASGVQEPRRYFSFASELASREGCAEVKSHSEARELVRAALLDSLTAHFVSDVPVGVFLSAGRDSGCLLALSTEVNESPPQSLTLAFEEFRGTPEDEAPLAERVAQRYGSQHHLRVVSGHDFQGDLDAILAAMDQPSVDGLNTFFVSKVAREAGIKVALSGLGADEIFGGYPSFHQVPRLVENMRGARAVPWLGPAFRAVSAPFIGRFTSPKYAGLLEYGGSYPGAYLLRRGLFMPWELPHVMDPDLAREGWRELQTLTTLEGLLGPVRSADAKVSALETQVYMRARLLRDSDWAGMSHSLEIRVPFVDVDLFRALAPLFGTPFRATKADMAASPANPLPDEVLNRPKTGFGVPVRQWLLGQGGSPGGERSLRGWARLVYRHFADS